MSNANDLSALAQDIVGAYDARVEAITSIKNGVSNLISDFQKGREDMADNLQQTFSDLKSILKKGEKERIKHNHTDLKGRMAEIKKGKAEVGNLLECFRDEINDFKKECEKTAVAWHDIVTTMQAKRSEGISSAKKPTNNRLRRKGARG